MHRHPFTLRNLRQRPFPQHILLKPNPLPLRQHLANLSQHTLIHPKHILTNRIIHTHPLHPIPILLQLTIIFPDLIQKSPTHRIIRIRRKPGQRSIMLLPSPPQRNTSLLIKLPIRITNPIFMYQMKNNPLMLLQHFIKHTFLQQQYPYMQRHPHCYSAVPQAYKSTPQPSHPQTSRHPRPKTQTF